jgi:hypothetical protein
MRLMPDGVARPERLYKYGGPDALAILRNRAIYLTRPAQFNDPFDTKPHFGTMAWVQPSPTSRVSAFPNMQVASAESLLRIANDVVLSLTPHPDSLLMWAHYAAAHTGIAIGFSGGSDILAEGSPHRALGPVMYTMNRPTAATHDDLTDTEVLFTKGSIGATRTSGGSSTVTFQRGSMHPTTRASDGRFTCNPTPSWRSFSAAAATGALSLMRYRFFGRPITKT